MTSDGHETAKHVFAHLEETGVVGATSSTPNHTASILHVACTVQRIMCEPLLAVSSI